MVNDTLLNNNQGDMKKETRESWIEVCHRSKLIYCVMFDVVKKVKELELIVNVIHINLYRTPWNTYLVRTWKAKNDKETFRNYKTIKEAWTYKRGLMRCKSGEFRNINLEENYDNFKQEDWR